jgi:hypothetical protein
LMRKATVSGQAVGLADGSGGGGGVRPWVGGIDAPLLWSLGMVGGTHAAPQQHPLLLPPPPPPFVLWCVLVPRGVTSLHVNQFVSLFFCACCSMCPDCVFLFMGLAGEARWSLCPVLTCPLIAIVCCVGDQLCVFTPQPSCRTLPHSCTSLPLCARTQYRVCV